jgi:AraC-like DNA-binding protein
VGKASGTPVAVRINVTTAERVRSALLEGIPNGLLTMEAMARQLATSKRTLQRRLEKGTSYQQVLTETREALARQHLKKTALPAAEVAFLLGFDEPKSFLPGPPAVDGKDAA